MIIIQYDPTSLGHCVLQELVVTPKLTRSLRDFTRERCSNLVAETLTDCRLDCKRLANGEFPDEKE
jgi:hypothetical protein